MKTHWKKEFDYDYLGSQDLEPGKDLVLTIKSVGKEQVTGQNGRKEELLVAKFNEAVKPMILNRTNCKIIAKVHGSQFIEDWCGKSVQLYVKPDVKFGSDVVEALRVRPMLPKVIEKKGKPVLNGSDAEKMSKAVQFVSEKGIDALLKVYEVSEDLKLVIVSEVKKLEQ